MSTVALVTDLFFASRIRSTAEGFCSPLTITRTEAEFAAALAGRPALAIIDMNASGADPAAAIRRCKTLDPAPRVVAYLSHIQKELADAATQAGADLVLPRSKFTQQLPSLLEEAARQIGA